MSAGLISAAPGGKRNEKGGLVQASQQVEAMVKAKMARPEYIILCLEDSSDWTNATTRRLVMAVRPSAFCTPLAPLNSRHSIRDTMTSPYGLHERGMCIPDPGAPHAWLAP